MYCSNKQENVRVRDKLPVYQMDIAHEINITCETFWHQIPSCKRSNTTKANSSERVNEYIKVDSFLLKEFIQYSGGHKRGRKQRS